MSYRKPTDYLCPNCKIQTMDDNVEIICADGQRIKVGRDIPSLLYDLNLMPEQCNTKRKDFLMLRVLATIECRELQLEAIKKERDEAMVSLKKIEDLCDSNNPTHEEIWKIAYRVFI